MDFTGLGRFTAYKINRPLTEQERTDRLHRKRALHVLPRDQLAVIKVNSTYLELVDRWYASKGWSIIFSMMLAAPCLAALVAFPLVFFEKKDYRLNWQAWGVQLFVIFSASGLLWLAWYGFRLEAFRQTHYPIRLNRRTRKVHAYRADGSILEANWDKLYFCVGESTVPAYGKTYDVRAHVMSKNRREVVDTFTLTYNYMGDKAGVKNSWEYIRRYMEEPDGVQQSWEYSDICVPVIGRREGLLFGIFYPFAGFSDSPIGQLIFSPFFSAGIVGRWISIYTSKVPVWPAEIEAEYVVEDGDPYVRDWRNNVELRFSEDRWPVICFIVGFATVAWVIWRLANDLLGG